MRLNYIRKRFTALLIDWLIMSLYIVLLLSITMLFYYIFFGKVPEITQMGTQFIAALTTVIPICIFSIVYEIKSKYGSIGKRIMGLQVVRSSKTIYHPIIRNIIKFLPWQLAHIAVIYGIYQGFGTTVFIIFYVLSLGLVILFISQVIFTKEHRHLGDILSKSKVTIFKNRIKNLDIDPGLDNHMKVLIKLAKLLNDYDLKWSLGASLMLKLRGFNVTVKDIDIIVNTDEIEKLERVLNTFGFKKEIRSSKYLTDHFYELVIDEIEVDIMVGFKVKTNTGIYTFNDDDKIEELKMNDVFIYLSSLEEWVKAYRAMNRADKVSMIEERLRIK